jgi:hypothetical protein
MWRSSDLLLFLLAVTAKPADWRGSRYDRWNDVPNENWWQYECRIPKCKESFQSPDKPTYAPICDKHRAIMRLIHDPTKG